MKDYDSSRFWEYWRDNMKATPGVKFIGVPGDAIEGSKAVFGLSVSLADYLATYGGARSVKELSEILGRIAQEVAEKRGVAYSGNAAAYVRAAGFVVQLGLAYYTGACIGSMCVAHYKCNRDNNYSPPGFIGPGQNFYKTRVKIYSITEVMTYAKQNNIKTCPELQKAYHRSPGIRCDYTN